MYIFLGNIYDCSSTRPSLHGFTDSYLASHLIGICADGASNMLGKTSGVLTRLKEKYPRALL